MINNAGTYDSASAKDITLKQILSILANLGATKVYVKKLAPNDNSKNQPYFGAHLPDVSFLPSGELVPSISRSSKTSDPKRSIKYQSPLNFSWFGPDGCVYEAPQAKLIYYPQYPEVRFSGFLQGSKVKAGNWMDPKKSGRSEGRWLILGTHPDRKIYAYLAIPESNLSRELGSINFSGINNIFGQIDIVQAAPVRSTRDALVAKLLGVHQKGWIPGQRLTSDLNLIPYRAQNGGGYTLEAELGIAPNGFAKPDYLGWEVKQFGVTRFPAVGAKPTTLLTPEPNGGFYKEQGAADFVRRYGYADKSGKPDRLNFGGKHIVDESHKLTNLTLKLVGFDPEGSKITDASGSIALFDGANNIAASWSYAKLMDHWKRKHAQAVYIPCAKNSNTLTGNIEYHYGKDIELGTGTNLEMILGSLHSGSVYYDPGIKLEKASSTTPKLKRRNQFRVAHKNLHALYNEFEFLDLTQNSESGLN